MDKEKIYKIEMDEEESDFSYEQRKWLTFKDAVAETFSKRIKESRKMIDLIMVLKEK